MMYNNEGDKMIEAFKKLQNEKQARFVEKLTPCATPSLGIKIPQIKAYVRTITPSYELLDQIKLNEYIEIDILYGFILNKLGKIKDEKYQKYLSYYFNYINNWMTCDTFIANTKYKEDEMDDLYQMIQELLKTNEEFKVRLGLIFLKKYFIKNTSYDEIYALIAHIQYGKYYVDMGCAWLLCSMACCNFSWFEKNKNNIQTLSPEVYKKTIQKIRDSYLITKEQKQSLV